MSFKEGNKCILKANKCILKANNKITNKGEQLYFKLL